VAAPVRAFISRDEDDLAARVAGLNDALGLRRVFEREDVADAAVISRLARQWPPSATGTGTAAP
jgi:hypothetical protein